MMCTVEDILNLYNVTLEDVKKVIDNTITKTIIANLLQGNIVSFNEASNIYKAAVVIKRGKINDQT